MKRAILIVSAILTLAVGAFAIYGTGWGQDELAVSTTPQRLTGFTTANTISVESLYSTNATVYLMANCTTNVLAARITAGTAIPLKAGRIYDFDIRQTGNIDSLCLATSAGGAVVNVATY